MTDLGLKAVGPKFSPTDSKERSRRKRNGTGLTGAVSLDMGLNENALAGITGFGGCRHPDRLCHPDRRRDSGRPRQPYRRRPGRARRSP